jgi:proteasome lid subunit RPN8/RPN11
MVFDRGSFKKWKIKHSCLKMILEASKSAYPKEFAALLRAEKDIITELILLPGTISGDSHAIFQFHMLPIDFSIVGTVHSHPSPIADASAADLELFNKRGLVHIIVAYPFNEKSWKAFDGRGREIDIEVVE